MESFLTAFLSSGEAWRWEEPLCKALSTNISVLYFNRVVHIWYTYTYDPFFQSCNNFPSFASWDAFRSWRGHKLWHFYCATWAALRGIHLREQAFRKPIWDLAGYWGCCGETEKKSFVTIKHIGWGTLTPLFAKSSNKESMFLFRSAVKTFKIPGSVLGSLAFENKSGISMGSHRVFFPSLSSPRSRATTCFWKPPWNIIA